MKTTHSSQFLLLSDKRLRPGYNHCRNPQSNHFHQRSTHYTKTINSIIKRGKKNIVIYSKIFNKSNITISYRQDKEIKLNGSNKTIEKMGISDKAKRMKSG